MAITITDQPTSFAKVGQKLMIVATSTNVAQPNFRYVVSVFNHFTSEIINNILVPPNPNNRLMFDLAHIVQNWVKLSPYSSYNTINHISGTDLLTLCEGDVLSTKITVTIKEGYDVVGVFTIDDESAVDGDNTAIINASYKVQSGYKPDPNDVYSFVGNTSLLLGGRKPTTHYPINYPIGAATANNQIVWIPVRKSELDWGTIGVISQGSIYEQLLTTTNDAVVRMTIYESTGTPSSTSAPILYIDKSSQICFMGVYPANLNLHGELLRPADFPNWRWYDIAMYDSTNTTRKSAIYRFYPVEDDCRFENVRLAWWNMEIGGFDFFNFDKKNEESIEVERKRVKKVVGTYAATSFSFNTFDRELAEGMVSRVDYINITSGWLQEGEFEFLKSLIASQLVYIVNDDGTLTPVLVEENNYTARKIREAKQYNYSMRLRYSQQFM